MSVINVGVNDVAVIVVVDDVSATIAHVVDVVAVDVVAADVVAVAAVDVVAVDVVAVVIVVVVVVADSPP